MKKRKQILARKLIVAILLFSSFITLFSIGSQLYFEYKRDISSLETSIDLIRDTSLRAISSALWAYNLRLVEIQLEGIQKIQDVQYLAIMDANGVVVEKGIPIIGKKIGEEFELVFTEGQKDFNLGTLRVEMSLTGVYERLKKRLAFIVTTQVAKTFLVATFMLVLIHLLVTRHLVTIAGYARDLSLSRMGKPLTLRRYRVVLRVPDELDDIENSINEMRDNLQKDIVELKRAEEQRNNLEKRLLQSQKMEAIGTLAGGIAHDFNNILSVIIGNAELVRELGGSVAERRKNIDNLLTAGYRAKDLISQILAFSRKEEHEYTIIQPATIIKEAVSFLRSSIPSSVVLQQNIEDCGEIKMDPTHLHQIVMNLCTNAYQALEESGGEIEITLTKVTNDAAILNTTEPVQECIELTIRDNGPGIPDRIANRIFEPYFTTKEAGRGTGMGLSIAYGIVSSAGGEIICESNQGKGTVFRVRLPLVKDEKESFKPGNSKNMGSLPRGTEHILCVDDEAELLNVTAEQLESLGYSVTTAASGIDAVKMFHQDPDLFDLVVTDQSMPKMSGLDLAGELRQIRPDITMMLVTGYSEIRPNKKREQNMFSKILKKPVLFHDLANCIRDVLDGKK